MTLQNGFCDKSTIALLAYILLVFYILYFFRTKDTLTSICVHVANFVVVQGIYLYCKVPISIPWSLLQSKPKIRTFSRINAHFKLMHWNFLPGIRKHFSHPNFRVDPTDLTRKLSVNTKIKRKLFHWFSCHTDHLMVLGSEARNSRLFWATKQKSHSKFVCCYCRLVTP